jgi:CheY-like chemotaxis protein
VVQALHSITSSSAFRTILIADDDQQLLNLYSFFFRREGYQVICAKDGYEAIEKFRASRPHLVILDYEMPRLDGLTVAREILLENASSNQKTEVFMISGNNKIRKEAEQTGVRLFLQKPVSLRKILDEIILPAEQCQMA